MRVLFVDDDVNVLFALRRTMHGMRNEWDMEFVSSAAQALQRLAAYPADVIVSDMRMPGMDGWNYSAKSKNSIRRPYVSCSPATPSRGNHAPRWRCSPIYFEARR